MMFPIKAVRFLFYAAVVGLVTAAAWFCSGLPATFALRKLSESPEIIVFTEEKSESFQKWTRIIENAPLRDTYRNFFLQYVEAQTSGITVRFLHPLISAEQLEKLGGLKVVSHLDVDGGVEADQVAARLVSLAPGLKILHLEGRLTDEGFRLICRGLPQLESLRLTRARLEQAEPGFAEVLPRLRELILADCALGRPFIDSVEERADVRVLIK